MNTEVIPVATTPGGKIVGYRIIPETPLYEICFVPGGAIPKALQGRWTRIREIESVINAWVNSEQAEKNAKANAAKTAKSKEE